MKTLAVNNKTYLYLTPFNDGKFFKIGRSTKTDYRLYVHDFTKTLIYTADNDAILKVIERELLIIFPKCNHPYNGVDGYTEIREIRHFEDCKTIINTKPKSLNIQKYKYDNIFKKVVIKRNQSKKILNDFSDNKKAIDLLLQYLKENKNRFIKSYFDSKSRLVLKFQMNDISDIDVFKSYKCWSSMSYSEVNKTITIRFQYYFKNDKLYSVKDQKIIDSICKILKIHPSSKQRDINLIDEQKRENNLNDYYNNCYRNDKPILFYDFISEEYIKVGLSKLFNNLDFVVNKGFGYYKLYYKSNESKIIFYSDGSENVKSNNENQYLYSSKEERNIFYKKQFNINRLFLNRFLVMDEMNLFYFRYLLHTKYKVSSTFKLNYPKSLNVYNLERNREDKIRN